MAAGDPEYTWKRAVDDAKAARLEHEIEALHRGEHRENEFGDLPGHMREDPVGPADSLIDPAVAAQLGMHVVSLGAQALRDEQRVAVEAITHSVPEQLFEAAKTVVENQRLKREAKREAQDPANTQPVYDAYELKQMERARARREREIPPPSRTRD